MVTDLMATHGRKVKVVNSDDAKNYMKGIYGNIHAVPNSIGSGYLYYHPGHKGPVGESWKTLANVWWLRIKPRMIQTLHNWTLMEKDNLRTPGIRLYGRTGENTFTETAKILHFDRMEREIRTGSTQYVLGSVSPKSKWTELELLAMIESSIILARENPNAYVGNKPGPKSDPEPEAINESATREDLL